MCCVQVINVLGHRTLFQLQSVKSTYRPPTHSNNLLIDTSNHVVFTNTEHIKHTVSSTMPARDPITVKRKQKRVIHVHTCTGYLPTRVVVYFQTVEGVQPSQPQQVRSVGRLGGQLCGQGDLPIV